MTPIKQSKILLLPLYSNKQWKFPNNCLKGTLLFSTGPLQSSNCCKSLKTNIVCRVGERDGRFLQQHCRRARNAVLIKGYIATYLLSECKASPTELLNLTRNAFCFN